MRIDYQFALRRQHTCILAPVICRNRFYQTLLSKRRICRDILGMHGRKPLNNKYTIHMHSCPGCSDPGLADYFERGRALFDREESEV